MVAVSVDSTAPKVPRPDVRRTTEAFATQKAIAPRRVVHCRNYETTCEEYVVQSRSYRSECALRAVYNGLAQLFFTAWRLAGNQSRCRKDVYGAAFYAI